MTKQSKSDLIADRSDTPDFKKPDLSIERRVEEIQSAIAKGTGSSGAGPVNELKGLKKVYLKPRETNTVKLTIFPEELVFTNINKKYSVEAGDFEIMVARSSRDRGLNKVLLHVV